MVRSAEETRVLYHAAPPLPRTLSQICDRAPARLNCRYDRRCCLRFPPSQSLCPSGYDPPAALAGGARPAHGDLHRRAGAGIRRSRHSLRRHRRPVCAAQSRAADRLQPDAAAGAGLCGGAARAQHRRTGRAAVLHRRPAEPVLISVSGPGPDLGDGAADPADHRARRARGRLRLGAGVLPSAAAVGQRRPAGAAADLSARRLALDRARDRRHQPLCVPGHRGGAQAFRRAGGDRTGADARAASDPARRPCRRRRARTRHAAVDDLPDFARAGKDRPSNVQAIGHARRRPQDPARTGAALPRYPGQDHPTVRLRRAVRPHAAVDADRGNGGAASRFRRRDQGADRGRSRARAGRHAQSGDPLRRRQHPGECRRFRADDGGGECVVEHRDRRDRHFRRRPGHRARHPQADRRTLSVAPARHR